MIGRNRRRNRQASMKGRLGIAAAVLVGGGAVGVATVAAGNHGPATTSEQTAGFIMNFHHRISEQAALSSAIGTWADSRNWRDSRQRSLSILAQMVPMRTFSQVWRHHTLYAAQRGVVELATRRFLLVRSAGGGLHLWWLTGGTKFLNVSASPAGMTAMTGDDTASVQAMVNQNMAPAAAVMAGSTAVANQMAAPAARPATVTVDTGTAVVTITITSTTATVTQPVTTAIMPVTPVAAVTPTATATQPVFTATSGVARGDLVFIAGVRVHGFLIAKLVLFSASLTPTPAVTAAPVNGTPFAPGMRAVNPAVPGTSATSWGTHS